MLRKIMINVSNDIQTPKTSEPSPSILLILHNYPPLPCSNSLLTLTPPIVGYYIICIIVLCNPNIISIFFSCIYFYNYMNIPLLKFVILCHKYIFLYIAIA